MSTPARKIRLLMKLRNDGIQDARVLAAIEQVPREMFLPEMFHDQAYEDIALPIGHGQTISQPFVVAMMSEALNAGPKDKVLEIGTGSGYQASVLAHLCRRVYTIERHRPLLAIAKERLEKLDLLRTISTRAGDGMLGWPEAAPFERIIVTAAAGGDVPPRLLAQLAVGGIMVLPMGRDKASQFIVRITQPEEGVFMQETLCPVRFVPLLPGDPGREPEPDDPLATLYKHFPLPQEKTS